MVNSIWCTATSRQMADRRRAHWRKKAAKLPQLAPPLSRRQLRPMRDQPVAVERNPFACVVTRFIGKPVEFGPTVIRLLCGFPTKRALPLIHGYVDSLMLCQGKRFQRAQYALLVNGLKCIAMAPLSYWV